MNNSVNNEIITFYDVPLVCGAAPAIGCGSRAKPLLIDLEQQTAIEEAWLNRAGTIVAIVWSDRFAPPRLRNRSLKNMRSSTRSGATTSQLLSEERAAGFAVPKSIV